MNDLHDDPAHKSTVLVVVEREIRKVGQDGGMTLTGHTTARWL